MAIAILFAKTSAQYAMQPVIHLVNTIVGCVRVVAKTFVQIAEQNAAIGATIGAMSVMIIAKICAKNVEQYVLIVRTGAWDATDTLVVIHVQYVIATAMVLAHIGAGIVMTIVKTRVQFAKHVAIQYATIGVKTVRVAARICA